jgi:hypothetical protein
MKKLGNKSVCLTSVKTYVVIHEFGFPLQYTRVWLVSFYESIGNKRTYYATTKHLLGWGQYLEASGHHCHLQPPNQQVVFDSFHSIFDGMTELHQLPSEIWACIN